MLKKEGTILKNKKIELVHSGFDYFYRLEQIIKNAKTEIHLQMYIFEDDTTGNRIINRLIEAADRNVKIYLLLDGFGSYSLSSESVLRMKLSGIQLRFFSPLLSANSFYIGRRMHHKVIVADSRIALIGGINIADKYKGSDKNMAWLDYAVQVNDVNIAEPLRVLCQDIYQKKQRSRRKKIAAAFYNHEKLQINILQNDWLKRKNEISDGYIKAIREAKEEIIIVGSYFLPGRKLSAALKKAARKKIRIKLILSGLSDINLARNATCHFYSKLLAFNMELYEWDKSILHGKAAVVDHKWTTIGSFNLNNLSSFASIEMNVAIHSESFAQDFQKHLQTIIIQCQRITPESLKLKDNLYSKIINWTSYWISRILLIFVTYLPYKRFLK